jgi:hypothetical protein
MPPCCEATDIVVPQTNVADFYPCQVKVVIGHWSSYGISELAEADFKNTRTEGRGRLQSAVFLSRQTFYWLRVETVLGGRMSLAFTDLLRCIFALLIYAKTGLNTDNQRHQRPRLIQWLFRALSARDKFVLVMPKYGV